MVDWGRAVKMPFQDWKKLGIAGLMYVIPVVNIVTSFFATGYGLKMAENSMKKKFSLPEWEDWGGLFLKGLLGAIISIIFMLPAMIVAFVGIRSTMFTMFSMMMSGTLDTYNLWGILFDSLGISVVVAVLLGLIAIYLLPAALMFFVKEDSFASAFNFSGIFKKVFTGDYFVAWLGLVVYGIIVGIIAGFISGLLAVTVVLPIVIMALVQAIVLITGMTVFGEVFQK
ncbi:DUF4013 domain-containing protein [Candidatus Woesearchaeota archaeon]|nr:DUF4013 domain-containing protein [Candidatus Woesearchaeota archaeon]